MHFFENQSQAWDTAHWELSLVFEDLQDSDLWRRPDPRLLSVGEVVAHVVYSEVKRANALNPGAHVESPLMRDEARYYLSSLGQPLVLPMTVAEMEAEVDRVQKVVKKALLAAPYEASDDAPPNGPGPTMGDLAIYMVFHVAYHTGQVFSARHLMGHKTNDN